MALGLTDATYEWLEDWRVGLGSKADAVPAAKPPPRKSSDVAEVDAFEMGGRAAAG